MGVADDIITVGYVTKPMISRPVRAEIFGGAAANLVYDIATKSSGPRSERNGPNVGPGGNKKRPDTYSIPQTGFKKKAGTKGPCADGYVLAKVKGRWLCMKKWDYFVGNQSPRKD
jgi:ribosomal protein S27AE